MFICFNHVLNMKIQTATALYIRIMYLLMEKMFRNIVRTIFLQTKTNFG